VKQHTLRILENKYKRGRNPIKIKV